MTRTNADNTAKAVLKPFVKWAGGKSQLLKEIEKTYPEELGKTINKYAEPFVGGGAVLFNVMNKYNFKEIYISDINSELINTYKSIRENILELIDMLKILEKEFIELEPEKQKKYYYTKREKFNEIKIISNNINIEKAALFIFLNKTCFNGLYRVSQKGLFNVPMGSYKNPNICDENNLKNISKELQKVKIVCGDYRESASFIDSNTFVYFDPPYRPISATSSFTSYTEMLFDDKNQIELASFVRQMADKGAKVVVSNSDPKNLNKEDDFFDTLYSSFKINRIAASRMINCNGYRRGKINELLIVNY